MFTSGMYILLIFGGFFIPFLYFPFYSLCRATMVKLIELAKKYEPSSIRVVSLLLKKTFRSNNYIPDYVGKSSSRLIQKEKKEIVFEKNDK